MNRMKLIPNENTGPIIGVRIQNGMPKWHSTNNAAANAGGKEITAPAGGEKRFPSAYN